MPVQFTVATHGANTASRQREPLTKPEDLLQRTWGSKHQTRKPICSELLQSSLGEQDLSLVLPERNGFVDTVIRAYNGHHHLVIRPDDVWIAILGQFNFYVNAHAEELRSHFVRHEGKKQLTVTAVGSRYSVDFGDLARQMAGEIQKNVVDTQLKDWILPNFTTTTKHDTIACAVSMMAIVKAYFDFRMRLLCGIPSVTLEGEKSDWEKLLSRLDKLGSFGPEPAAWVTLLRPILRRFVDAFDGKPDIDFWNKVCHREGGGSGPTYLSGWITAFCAWSSEGRWQGPPLSQFDSRLPSGNSGSLSTGYWESRTVPLVLDGVQYSAIDINHVPLGFCEVDVKLDDNGQEFDCMMVSGHLAGLVEGQWKDAVRPLPTWFMFVVDRS